MRVTILGCGPSLGVPRIGNDWGNCDPDNMKNRRRRPGVLIQSRSSPGTTSLLIDTSPDLRSQLIDAEVDNIDGVILTHEHADHLHGASELRIYAENTGENIDFYMGRESSLVVLRRFAELFDKSKSWNGGGYLRPKIVTPGEPESIFGPGGEIRFTTFLQSHGNIDSLGIRIGKFAYSVDFNSLDQQALKSLQGVETWVIDCLRDGSHSSHNSLSGALKFIDTIKPKRAILTGMDISLDYEELRKSLPAGIEPAYDGMSIDI